MYYKAPNNSVHFLDSAEYEHLLPDGSVQITDEEAQALRPVNVLTPLDLIAQIEDANPITHRNLRDLTLSLAQLAGTVLGLDPSVNPAVKQVLAVSAQIDPLRAEAKAQGLIP